MNIAIIVAMDKELQLLLPLLSEPRETIIDGITFYLGDMGAHSVIIMKSGIGKVNAALATSRLIQHFAPDVVLNTGVAGGTGTETAVLDVVIGERVAYHDVWCGPGTVEGQAANCPKYFTGDSRVMDLPCIAANPVVHRGLIASGDIFVTSEALPRIKELYPDVIAVDMESAAIAHTCFLHGTPFVSIRIISDTPGDSDNAQQYDNFWEAAPRRAFQILNDVLAELPE